MAPQTVVIVGGVLITVGAGIAFKEYAWPHIKEFAEPKLQRLRAEWEAHVRAILRPRQRVPPHQHHSSPNVEQDYLQREKRSVGSSHDEKSTHPLNLEGNRLRKRQTHATSGSEPEVEMMQFDKQVNPIPRMSSTPTRPPKALDDIDPFEDPKDGILPPCEAAAVPLPQSPEASFNSSLASSRRSDVNPLISHLGGLSHEFPTSVMQPKAVSPPASHKDVEEPLTPRSPPLPAFSPPLIQSEILQSPPVIYASRESLVNRPDTASPSPSEAASFVSATPSRTWTEGGTDRIFSDAEHDFRGNESDDDVRSVSESGSWESVSAGPASPSLGASGRLTR